MKRYKFLKVAGIALKISAWLALSSGTLFGMIILAAGGVVIPLASAVMIGLIFIVMSTLIFLLFYTISEIIRVLLEIRDICLGG